MDISSDSGAGFASAGFVAALACASTLFSAASAFAFASAMSAFALASADAGSAGGGVPEAPPQPIVRQTANHSFALIRSLPAGHASGVATISPAWGANNDD